MSDSGGHQVNRKRLFSQQYSWQSLFHGPPLYSTAVCRSRVGSRILKSDQLVMAKHTINFGNPTLELRGFFLGAGLLLSYSFFLLLFELQHFLLFQI